MKPITKIIVALVSSAILCQVLFLGIYKGYAKYYAYSSDTLNEILESNTAHDVLFLGSSSTYTGIYTHLIDSLCNINAYNAGTSGGNLHEFKMLFDAYLIHHPSPKIVVLNLDLHSFVGGFKFGNHLKYYHYIDNRIIDSVLNASGHSTKALKIFPFLMVSELDDYTRGNALKGLLGTESEIGPGCLHGKGCLTRGPATLRVTPRDTALLLKTIEVSDTNVAYLRSIIKTCQDRNIKLMFTYAPEFKQLWQNKIIANKLEVFGLITKMAAENNIPYHRYDSLEWCRDPSNFNDVLHTNNDGAIKYTTALAHDICGYK